MSAAAGWAAAQNIWYLQDLNSVIIDELFPGLLTQEADDWLAHPGPGRRADEVAEFYFVHRCHSHKLLVMQHTLAALWPLPVSA